MTEHGEASGRVSAAASQVAAWWSGWCTDHDGEMPDLALLGGFLIEVKGLLKDYAELGEHGEGETR